MAHTNTWDASYEALPTNDNYVYEVDNYIRELILNIRERVAKDHYFDIAGTDADHGEHSKITFQAQSAKPTAVANKGFLYTKDVSAKVELFFEDEDANEIQLTDGGQVHGGIEAGTKMVFYQDTAPTGWTIDNTLDDKLLFVTKGAAAGGETGGGAHSAGTWTQPNHLHTTGDVTLTAAQSGVPAHTHPHAHALTTIASGGGTTGYWVNGYDATNVSSANTGSDATANAAANASQAHNHGNTGNSATANTWRPAAYCVIVCEKD
jgi:hypothetical protein